VSFSFRDPMAQAADAAGIERRRYRLRRDPA
jgi:hypothetical protein